MEWNGVKGDKLEMKWKGKEKKRKEKKGNYEMKRKFWMEFDITRSLYVHIYNNGVIMYVWMIFFWGGGEEGEMQIVSANLRIPI